MTANNINGTAISLSPTYFLKHATDQSSSAVLMVLNCPIKHLSDLQRLYDHATFRLMVDGGANRLHDLLIRSAPGSEWSEVLRTALPDLICGDLDSIHSHVYDRYRAIGVKISKNPDQYSTDFGKAVDEIAARTPQARDILVVGSIGGRVDQGIGLLHEFYREQMIRHPGFRFWLFSESSVSTMITPGTTLVHTPLGEGLIKPNIGILPLYGPAKISTRGLEWDVEDWKTEMGDQVSTSNHIIDDWISITTDHNVLFTIERAAEE